ncbi:Lin0512 family protein [Fluviibacterium sp. DFM31]|uniref:Lin0512 family protein n=1 Tax=Meridianimarinicoccus marinus TaxID=3231483 RepID=A0ABV3L728_9RHOB
MTDQRAIIKMGMGTGKTIDEAVAHGLLDAASHSTLQFLDKLTEARQRLRIKVSLGVSDPAQVDAPAVAAQFSPAPTEVIVAKGGLTSTDPETGSTVQIAAVAVEVFLPPMSSSTP